MTEFEPTPDMRGAAIHALATVPDDPYGIRKLRAMKHLRDATGLGLRECAQLIDWATVRPKTTLTRAAKEQAVAEMANLLVAAVAAYEQARGTVVIEGPARVLRRRHAALVRLAMARTVD